MGITDSNSLPNDVGIQYEPSTGLESKRNQTLFGDFKLIVLVLIIKGALTVSSTHRQHSLH